MNRAMRFNLMYFLMAAFAIMVIHDVWVSYNQVSHLPYSEFQKLLNDGKIEEVIAAENYLQGKLKSPDEQGRTQFVTVRVDPALVADLEKARVTKFSRVIESTLVKDLISWVVPVLVFFGIWVLLMRRLGKNGGLGGQFMSIGKSKAKVYMESDTKTTFKDVAGVEEAKEELIEIVSFLKDPAAAGRLGGRLPKGTLLVGPPGTGKTLLAKAVAGEAGVPFFSISGSEFVEMFVGVGAARVRDLFEQARLKAPCIVFIDELDALGRSRASGGFSGGHDEKEQTLNQLLVEMDGFDSMVGIVLLAATNRPEILDPALLRAGRFDRQVLVDRPDKKGRTEILSVHVKRIKLSPEVDLNQVAALTPGFTGADLANLVNESALAATRRKGEMVTLEDFTEAVERMVAGLEKKNRILNPEEIKVVAYHEMGHALLGAALPGSDTVHKVSVIPRGVGALGYTIQRPIEDRYLTTAAELENKMAILLGGRAAEKLVFGHVSSGASDDISKATGIARTMITRLGMDDTLGNMAYDQEPASFLGGTSLHTRGYSEATAREIDAAIRKYVDRALSRSLAILEPNLDLLHESALKLLEKETLVESDLQTFFSRMRMPVA